MNNLNYKQLQTIQDKATKKLLNYINEFLKEDNSLDSVEFYYPNFDEQKTRIAFNIWISTDYKTDYNKTFIEHMLEERSSQLSTTEKRILIERNRSHISLFEVSKVENEYIELMDLLTREDHTLWDPNAAKILKDSDLIFCRVGKVLNHESFIGNISFLPPSIREVFIREVFLDYNYIRLDYSELSIYSYLKQYSVNVYRIYTECIYDALELDEDSTSIFYDEIEEFEGLLQAKNCRTTIKKHITNLINLYEFYLLGQDMTLYDLGLVDLYELFEEAIEEGFITSQRELSSHISTLKLYLKFLKSKYNSYEEAYRDIMEINRNRFLYTKRFQQLDPVFHIDANISMGVADILNERALRFIIDYEKFILYIMNGHIEYTAKRNYVKRKDLIRLNDIMENKESILKKAPNQEDFTMLHLFYKFSLDNDLIEIGPKLLETSKKASQFLRLHDRDKYSLLIQYLWSDRFLSNVCNRLDLEEAKIIKENILKLFTSLKPNTFYRINALLPAYVDSPKILSQHNNYLEFAGLVKRKYEPHLGIDITSLGKVVFKALTGIDEAEESNFKIIDLSKYKDLYRGGFEYENS